MASLKNVKSYTKGDKKALERNRTKKKRSPSRSLRSRYGLS